jgi:serine/threonine-protein phosphatase PP1 catalytic subunit
MAFTINVINQFIVDKRRIPIKIWNIFCNIFKCLPAAAVIGDRIFRVYGGLSPYLSKL